MKQLLGGTQAPKTAQELAALIEKRDELTGQLATLNEQRSSLAYQIERLGSDPVVRSGPVGRLNALDARIGKIEAELATSNELIAAAKAKGLSADREAETAVYAPQPGPIVLPNLPRIDMEHEAVQPSWGDRLTHDLQTTAPIALASVVLLGAVMYWWISRTVRGQLTRLVALQSAKLEELQRSVDTVAVEMERVSENQRYVTKLVGDRPQVPSK